MNKTLIVLKLADSVVVPEKLDSTVVLGPGYYEAQKLRLAVYRKEETFDEKSFLTLLNGIRRLFGNKTVFNLYFLCDRVAYYKQGYGAVNVLNHFAFILDATGDKLEKELTKLREVTANVRIDHWWVEGAMTLTPSPSSPAGSYGTWHAVQRLLAKRSPKVARAVRSTTTCSTRSDYYTVLGVDAFLHRGEGVTILDAEDYGPGPRLIPHHAYLSGRTVDVVPGTLPSDPPASDPYGDVPHFFKTMGVLAAQTPARATETLTGLVPDAAIILCSFPRANLSLPQQTVIDFVANFHVRNVITTAITSGRAGVLLIERSVPLPFSRSASFNFPIETLLDVRGLFQECIQANVIVVQPAAWQSNIFSTNHPDLNTYLNHLKVYGNGQTPTLQYTDFSGSFATPSATYTGSFSVLVSAIDATNHIQAYANQGTLINVYLWGACVRSLSRTRLSYYSAASAASAITAGIVAALQSAALTKGKRATLAQFNTVFTQCFRVGGADYTPTTLTQLWTQLQLLL
jgi:hypothetical protein